MLKNKTTENSFKLKPLLYFLGVGVTLGVIFIILLSESSAEKHQKQVIFTRTDVEQVRAQFMRTWIRPPNSAELKKAFDRYVRDEILFREAKKRKLDENDSIIRQTLVRKITMLGTAQIESKMPTSEDVKAFFQLRRGQYRRPGTLSFQQVCRASYTGEANEEPEFQNLLLNLNSKTIRPEDLNKLSQVKMLPNNYKKMATSTISREFGTRFLKSIQKLEVGDWQGPIESGYGLHAVRIIAIEPSYSPEWEDVKGQVYNDFIYENRKSAGDQFYSEILPNYEVLLNTEAEQALAPQEDDITHGK